VFIATGYALIYLTMLLVIPDVPQIIVISGIGHIGIIRAEKIQKDIGKIEDSEMYRAFNMGIGMALIARPILVLFTNWSIATIKNREVARMMI
jgi:hypothetical protein